MTEFWLRLPGLLGGLLFFGAVYRICRLYFGNSFRFLATFLVLTLNPFTLNYLSLSSGVGWAAGLYLLAIEQLSRILKEQTGASAVRLWRASLALGLAVTFQFDFAVPAIALVLAFFYCQFWGGYRLSGLTILNTLVLPGALIGFVFTILPMLGTTRQSFAGGARSASASAESILKPAFRDASVPMAALLTAAGALILYRLLTTRRAPEQLIGGTLLVSVALAALIHWFAGTGYPAGAGAFPYAVLAPLLVSACADPEPGWFGT
ncbi:MAG: hypothetical protein M3Z09_10020, partial [Acidobacteriota bacterium]|nr:hypothetical protein [Acidobacteriota bacterium]